MHKASGWILMSWSAWQLRRREWNTSREDISLEGVSCQSKCWRDQPVEWYSYLLSGRCRRNPSSICPTILDSIKSWNYRATPKCSRIMYVDPWYDSVELTGRLHHIWMQYNTDRQSSFGAGFLFQLHVMAFRWGRHRQRLFSNDRRYHRIGKSRGVLRAASASNEKYH